MVKTLATAVAFSVLVSSAAFAQTTAPAAPAAPAAAAPAPDAAPAADAAAPAMDKKAKSKDCYAQATQQNLHGKARKHFHSKCMKG